MCRGGLSSAVPRRGAGRKVKDLWRHIVRAIVPDYLSQSVEAKRPTLLSVASLHLFLSSIVHRLFKCSLTFTPTVFKKVTQESEDVELSNTFKSWNINHSLFTSSKAQLQVMLSICGLTPGALNDEELSHTSTHMWNGSFLGPVSSELRRIIMLQLHPRPQRSLNNV